MSWRWPVKSMGRVGACGDNAAMESFFSLLQKNVLDKRRAQRRAESIPGVTLSEGPDDVDAN